ncbi:MAG: phosphatidylinositol N-acetylglucosaminyltransferase subunit gpi1 [Icmadophila ericetorum]|nr:phosphatidylinositol N-acetylglucosaminyltransferase subunit gpi1 [Icmadophila ericetorum]
MVVSDGLLRIFWPSDTLRNQTTGTIVGWKNSDLDIFVVSIFQDVLARNVENALRVGTLFRSSSHPIERIFQLCGKPSIQVLGTTNPQKKPSTFDPFHLYAYTNPNSPFPLIYCPGGQELSVQVVLFDRPSPIRMQFLSLDPISLALDDKFTGDGGFSLSSDAQEASKLRLVNKLKQHSVVKHAGSQKEYILPVILKQINCSSELDQLMSKNLSLIGTRQKRSLSVSERVVESATTVWDYILVGIWHMLTLWIFPVLTRIFIIGLICHRCVAEVILYILEWRLRPESAALRDLSATAQQVDIRLQQFCYWPIQYTTLRKRKDDWESKTDRHPDYIRFYNSVWLVANDIIIGMALGSYIIDNAEWVALQINMVLTNWTVVGLQSRIIWLTDWPGGLKLNTELASFLGGLFLWVIEYWSSKSLFVVVLLHCKLTQDHRLCR